MIAVRLEGRLGNQMFQYAFIYAASKKLGTRFYIDQYTTKSVLEKYFDFSDDYSRNLIERLFNIPGYKNIFDFYLRRLYYKSICKWHNLSPANYPFIVNVEEVEIRNKTLYSGYFQSWLYFSAFSETIKKKFSLKKIFTEQFDIKFRHVYQTKKTVTVHVRRTDYTDLAHLNLGGPDLSLPLKYYESAISKFDGQDVLFIFITDDAAFVNENFQHISNRMVSEENEITDFQHLLNADGCIISNSTFSWWGAWLNNKAGKMVYAPKYFMGWRSGNETPKDIYPPDWIQIDF